MDRWQKAQEAEMKFKSEYYGANSKLDKSEDWSSEFRAIGMDPLTVTGRVIDIGGARGSFCIPFTNASERIVLDPLYDRVKSDLPGIRGISTRGERLPFEDGSVNFVILRNVIDHTLDPEAIVREARRVLDQEGFVYFMVNTFISPLKPAFPVLNRIDGPHPVHLTYRDIRTMLLKYFSVLRERTCSSGEPSLPLKRFAGWLVKREYYALLAHK